MLVRLLSLGLIAMIILAEVAIVLVIVTVGLINLDNMKPSESSTGFGPTELSNLTALSRSSWSGASTTVVDGS